MTQGNKPPFSDVPRRLLLDTCVVNMLLDEGGYIAEGELPAGCDCDIDVPADLRALRVIMTVNERAGFEFKTSPLTLAEVGNQRSLEAIVHRVRWVLDVMDHWLITLDESGDRVADGGEVRHRFKLSDELQELEARLMEIPDFRKDPIDRLLLIESRMAQCDAFLTTDHRTIWKHREKLLCEGIRVLTPSDFGELLEPWARLWC
jgi:hypothetical protein